MIKAAVLTVSDRCSRGQREDASGQTVADILCKNGFSVCERKIVSDDADRITAELIRFSDQAGCELIFTTGGTGLGPRDVTPEATTAICEKLVPGLAELMRLKGLEKTPNAALSRAVVGVRNKTLIVNLPGSPKAVSECLEVILDVLPHAFEMMRGGGH